MTGKMSSFVKGILMGLLGHPLPQGKEPVEQAEPAESGTVEAKE